MNITIVGGGFGGVKTALELAKNKNNQITLITDKPDFQYYPALYSAATGHSHNQSWVALGEIFAGRPNIEVVLDTITDINPDKKTIGSNSGQTYRYKTLVLALGTVTTFFGIKGLDTFAYGIKSADEIKRLKHHLYEEFAVKHAMDKQYVVIGAGPTGVELAAALGTYLDRLRDHYKLTHKRPTIHLIEAAPRVLPKMHPSTSRLVEKRLKRLGVKVSVGQTVESETADTLMVSGKPIKSQTVIWTSGVANHPFYTANKDSFSFAPNGKIIVDDFMRTKDGIYVIGDNAATPYSGLAQTALHDALYVTRTITDTQKGKVLGKYKVKRPPVVVPVGDGWAVFEWKFIQIRGLIAALIRMASDVIGYSDVLPFGQALGVWRTQRIREDDYFAPSSSDTLV